MDPIPDLAPVAEKLLSLLLEQYRDKARMTGIIQQIGEECDRLNVSAHELLYLYDLDTVTGVQLDVLGEIANEPRLGRTDEAYRAVLKVLFRTQVSGTPEDIIRSVKEYTGATSVVYLPEYPAAFWIISDAPGLTVEFLERVSPAGVGAYPACFLADTTGELITDTTDDFILVVGPCDAAKYPTDRTWDGGVGTVNPDLMVFSDVWPFRDGSGIGEQPDGGLGSIDPLDYTFTDGTYAEDTGGN